jgi:hypothetical protein
LYAAVHLYRVARSLPCVARIAGVMIVARIAGVMTAARIAGVMIVPDNPTMIMAAVMTMVDSRIGVMTMIGMMIEVVIKDAAMMMNILGAVMMETIAGALVVSPPPTSTLLAKSAIFMVILQWSVGGVLEMIARIIEIVASRVQTFILWS